MAKKPLGPAGPAESSTTEKPTTFAATFAESAKAALRAAQILTQDRLFSPDALRKLNPEELEELDDKELMEELFIERELVRLLGPIDSFRLQRDKNRDLGFTGWLIGRGERERDITEGQRATRVDIYLTTNENVIAHVCRLRGDGGVIGCSAGVFKTTILADMAEQPPWVEVQDMEKVLEWLKADTNGALGPASKQAWEMACKRLPWIDYLEVEIV